jgi:hypothetical protein
MLYKCKIPILSPRYATITLPNAYDGYAMLYIIVRATFHPQGSDFVKATSMF